MDVATGVYLVSTRSAIYEMDVTQMLLLHIPRGGDVVGSSEGDGVFVKLLGIYECTVGRPLRMRLYFRALGLEITIRTTAKVVSIVQIRAPELKHRFSWRWRRSRLRTGSSRKGPSQPEP